MNINLIKLLKTLYSKYRTYALVTMPYRQYIFEVKFKDIETIAECKSPYLLSSSFNAFLKELYHKGYIVVDNKEYSTYNVEYTKLIKFNTFYAYVFDTISDRMSSLPSIIQYQSLIKRQKLYIKYAKHLTPQKLKEIINLSKNYYV